MRTIAQS